MKVVKSNIDLRVLYNAGESSRAGHIDLGLYFSISKTWLVQQYLRHQQVFYTLETIGFHITR